VCFNEQKMVQNFFLFFQHTLIFSCCICGFSIRTSVRQSRSSVIITVYFTLIALCVFYDTAERRITSFSRTFVFISRHPRDRYYPSLFPRQCRRPHLENAVSEKPSSFSNFHFLILVTVWLLSSCIPSSFSLFRKRHQRFPQTIVENHNERESRENCSLNNRESS